MFRYAPRFFTIKSIDNFKNLIFKIIFKQKKNMTTILNQHVETLANNHDYSKYGVESSDRFWYKETMKNRLKGYIDGSIKISPELHKLVYNEDLDRNKKNITDNVFEHIKYLHCYGGGFNNNDYFKLPGKFTRHTYSFLKEYSKTNTLENHKVIVKDLCKKYNFSHSYANVIAQAWLYKPWNATLLEQSNL